MYDQIIGKAVVPVADITDLTADVNLGYPNGIGKRKGMQVYADDAGVLILHQATGALPADTWRPVTYGAAVTPV